MIMYDTEKEHMLLSANIGENIHLNISERKK